MDIGGIRTALDTIWLSPKDKNAVELRAALKLYIVAQSLREGVDITTMLAKAENLLEAVIEESKQG